jgi:hypothetical protein
MKKIMMLAATLVMVGCGEKKADTMPADTAAMAPAAADTGTGMGGMAHDSGMTTSDTTMARDTTAK